MTFTICEDEAYFASRLSDMVSDYIGQRELEGRVAVFGSGEELLRSGTRSDITLMDIRLPGRDGMKTAEKIRAEGACGQLIFVTAYPEYALGAFDLDAVNYLLKPVKREKLHAALDRALERASRESRNSLLLSHGDRSVRIFAPDILYCEAFGHRVTVHTLSGEYGFPGTLETLEGELGGGFFRCHKSCLVNLEHVTGLGRGFAGLLGGARVSVSRRRQAELARRLLALCRGGDGV